MKPRITMITLGIDDLERALAFYRDRLGLPTQGIVGHGHNFQTRVYSQIFAGSVPALALRVRQDSAARVLTS